MARAQAADVPSLPWRIAISVISLLLTTAIAEAFVRRLDGSALPRLRLFGQERDGEIVIVPNAEFRLIGSQGRVCDIATGPYGVRVPAPGAAPASRGAWLVVGDSQVLGFGVANADTFASRASRDGVPMINAGVPGYGVEDALRRAESLIAPLHPRGILVVVNQANDWEEVRQPAEQRFRVRGGWLLQAASADGWLAACLASPLSRLHLFYYAMQPVVRSRAPNFAAAAVTPDWLRAPRSQVDASRVVGDAVRRFAAKHPDVDVVVGFLPVDCATSAVRASRSPFGPVLHGLRPWTDHTLRDQLRQSLAGIRMIDFLPVLGNSDDFLDADYHLSPQGHLAVARVLVRELSQ